MKYFALAFAALSALLSSAHAQVTVEIRPEQDKFLLGESLPVAVRITNRSGQTLHMGAEVDWLTFSIEAREGFIVDKSGEAPVLGAFDLEPSKVGTKHVELQPYFGLTRQGRYTVTATVKLKDWENPFTSEPREFGIIQAARLWTQEVGVPARDGDTNAAPEVRRYSLEQANYLRNQLRLYFRLTSADETRVIKLFSIGAMVSFSQPEPQIDRSNNLHVLYQNGPRTFSYTVINPDGEIITRHTYGMADGHPRMKRGEDGKLFVNGGVRRAMANDIPAAKKTE